MPDLLERLQAALADRYAVESEIGRGGMATVYLAEDLKHRRKVAIKVMHPELASSVGAERFLREIEIAAGLDHPHILKLLDSGEANDLLYYVMPCVEGESLRERLAREHQLPIEEAIRIAHEVADGLGYAHRHGVVHRDIKPANIMLADGHALIADFGVARAVGGEGQALTSTGLAVGTPAYMSPEQASGGTVDARSDLYALGCVLYEMLAGMPPLTGPTPQATAAMRLTETATALPVIRDTVPAGLDRVTRNLLAKSPADRFVTAEKLVEALDESDLWAEAKPERRVWKRVGSVTVALVLLVFGIYATQWFADRTSGGSLELAPQRVAVLPFENRTGDPAWDDLGELAAERVTTRLQREGVGEVVPPSAVTAAIPSSGDGNTAQAVAAATGAALVITGAYSIEGDSLAIAVRIVDGDRGTQAGSFDLAIRAEEARGAGLDELGSRLAGGLLYAFSPTLPTWAFSTFPTVEASRLLMEARDLNVDLKHEEAVTRYQAAWERDTTFWLPLYYQIAAHHNLGQLATADSLNRFIGERFRSTMTAAQRYGYDASRAWFERDLETSYRKYGGRGNLAFYCIATNRPREVVETFQGIEDPHSEDVGNRAWNERHLANAHHMLGEFDAELAAAQRIQQLGGLTRLEREYLAARALAALGRVDEVDQALYRFESLSDSTVDAPLYMLAVGLELRYHGYRDAALPAVERVVRWFEERPDRLERDTDHRLLFAAALYHAGRWEDAEQALRRVREDTPANVQAIGYSGLLAARNGDVVMATEYADELEEVGLAAYNLRAQTWQYRARIAALLGNGVEAVSHLKRAFDEGLMYKPSYHLWRQYRFDFEGMADYAPYQALLRPKG
jgi:tRNA A-37 threonylcarbamoyl transferase component Bud32/TolB-like protein